MVFGWLVCLPHRNLSRGIKTKPLSQRGLMFWSSVSERITSFLFFDFKARANYAYDRASNFCYVPGCALDTLQSCRGIHINALSPLLKSPCIINTAKLPLLQAVEFMQSLPLCLTYNKIRNKNKKILKKAWKINQIHRKPSFLGHNKSWSYFLSPRLLKEYNFFICNGFFGTVSSC